MRRRDFITGIAGSAATWPLTARAQQADRVRLVAVLMSSDDEPPASAFKRALDGLGWREGRSIRTEIRYSASDISRARKYAAELFAMTPDVFLAGNTQMVQLIQEKTRSIPIVFVTVPDPVGSGFVASFARPGGNITGFTNFDSSMGEKWLELLKDVCPNLVRVAVILQAGNPTAPGFLKAVEAAARVYSVFVTPANVSDGPSIQSAINAFAREPNGGLLVPPSALAVVFRNEIISLAARTRLPAIYPYAEYTAAGGLMSYGFDRTILYQQAASYVHRILKGEKPADLPVQAPTRFELIINLKIAKMLGLNVPTSILLRADKVIE